MKRFYSCHKTDNICGLYGFGGHCLQVTDICMDFEPCFKVYNFVSVYPQIIKLGEMTTMNVIFQFMWWYQFKDWLKIETRFSSLRNAGMANWFMV